VPGAEGGRTNRTQTAFLQRAAGPVASLVAAISSSLGSWGNSGNVLGAALSQFGALVRRDLICLHEGEGGGALRGTDEAAYELLK